MAYSSCSVGGNAGTACSDAAKR